MKRIPAFSADEARWERLLTALAKAGVPHLDLTNLATTHEPHLCSPASQAPIRSLIIRDKAEIIDTYRRDGRWSGWTVYALTTPTWQRGPSNIIAATVALVVEALERPEAA